MAETAMAILSLPIPRDPALAGAKIFLQGLVFHLPTPRIRLTNVEAETILKL